MMGNIVEIRAHEGDRVQSGQVLAILDDAQSRSGTDQATAACDMQRKKKSPPPIRTLLSPKPR